MAFKDEDQDMSQAEAPDTESGQDFYEEATEEEKPLRYGEDDADLDMGD